MLAPILPDETDRVDALRSFGVLDTPPEPAYDDVTRLAAAICGTPIALVSLVDPCRQWFKSRFGLDATETHRDIAFCTHAIVKNELFVVPDAAADDRFKDNPLVTGEPHIRFYAGMPLPTPDGHNIGTLCVIDRVPRALTDVQVDALRVLARQVVSQLLLGREVEKSKAVEAHLRVTDQKFRAIFDTMFEFVGLLDTDGTVLEANRTALDAIGLNPSDVVGRSYSETAWWTHDPDQQERLRDGIRRAAGGEFVRFDTTLPMPDGSVAIIDFSLKPVFDANGAVILLVPEGRDVTGVRKVEADLRESEARFRSFMDHSPAIAFMKDALGRFVYVNEPMAEQLDRPAGEWIGKTDHDFFPAAYADEYRAHDRAVLAGDGVVALTETTPGRDGETTHWRSYKFPFTDAAGRRLLAGMSMDVTFERKAEEALRTSEAKFRCTVDRLAEGVFVVDAGTGRFVEANAALLDMLGYATAEFMALEAFDIVAGETPNVYARNLKDMHDKLARDGRCDVGRRRLRRKNGAAVPVDIRVTVAANGGAGLHAFVVRDVTEQIEYENRLFEYQWDLEDANAKLKALATTDALTGVKNRGAFNDTLAEAYERAVRHTRPLSVILMDVDYFKLFNDSFGHPAGDDVLKAVAATLKATARAYDTVARYGGEEFAVILPDTDYSGAMVLAERCRRAIAGAAWDKRPITVSVGVSSFTQRTADAAVLVKEADLALYQSKQAGRNRVNHGSGAVSMLAATQA